MSECEIVRMINRTKTINYNFLKNPKYMARKIVKIGLPLLPCARNVQLPVDLS